MLREKRHTKPPTAYEIPLICYPRKRNKKLEKCKFESIPLPLKFAYVGGVFHFYGGISLQKSYGKLKTQSALLSECFKCEEVKVTQLNESKIVNMRFMKLPVFHYPPWQPMVEKLSSSKKPEVYQWANIIKYYCLNYEDKLRAWSNLDTYRKQYTEEKLIEMNKGSEKRIVDYCEQYPCIVFRAQLSEGQMQFSDVIVNEEYLEHAGYTVDNFAVTILRDGLPQLLPGNNINAVKIFLENYRSIERCDFQTSEMASDLLTRKGYTRKVTYKAHYSATYRDGVPGMDCVWMLTNAEPMALAIKSTADCRLNKGYLEEAIKKEQQADEFLQMYYNTSSTGEYANLSKVCKIKEIGHEQTEKDGRSC